MSQAARHGPPPVPFAQPWGLHQVGSMALDASRHHLRRDLRRDEYVTWAAGAIGRYLVGGVLVCFFCFFVVCFSLFVGGWCFFLFVSLVRRVWSWGDFCVLFQFGGFIFVWVFWLGGIIVFWVGCFRCVNNNPGLQLFLMPFWARMAIFLDDVSEAKERGCGGGLGWLAAFGVLVYWKGVVFFLPSSTVVNTDLAQRKDMRNLTKQSSLSWDQSCLDSFLFL